MTTYEELVELLSSEFKIPRDQLEKDKPLAAYGLDSLALVELLFTVEEHFQIDFPSDGPRFDTLAELAGTIDELALKTAA